MVDIRPADAALLESLVPPDMLRALRQPFPTPEAIAAGCAELESILTALVPFVPSPVVDIQLAVPGPRQVAGQQLTGSVLFAEASGFNALSSEMSRLGRYGSEQLGAILNDVFTALLGEITPRGGGIVKFGGDTLTAFFDAAKLGGRHAALACAAALAMQARIAEFESIQTGTGPFRLQLRIAVHSGRMFAAEVGDLSHTELIITGRLINRVAVAQESAAPGEIIISDDTLEALDTPQVQHRVGDLYLLQALSSEPRPPATMPATWRPGPPSLETLHALIYRIRAIRPYITGNLPVRLAQEPTPSGEFRPVTLLFANFYPLSKLLALLEVPALLEQDAAIVGRVLNTYYLRTQEIIQHYGGSINKIDMAIYGDRLMALFGAPVAYEDDPLRAVQAALALRASHEETNYEIASMMHAWAEAHPQHRALVKLIRVVLNQRVGLATGTVFAGMIGTEQRRDYSIVGEPVSLAARLMAAASDGDVLLSSETWHAARQVVKVQQLPPLTARDSDRPVPVYRALQPRDSASAPTDDLPSAAPMVGRAAELTQVLESARQGFERGAGAGQVVAIVGEPGFGKTRLAREVVVSLGATAPDARVAWGACQSYDQTTAYAPIAQLLRQLLELSSAEDRFAEMSIVEEQIAALVPAWNRFAPLLGPLLHLPLLETELTRALTLEQRRDRLHDLVVELCLAVASAEPLLLVIDDMHWADASSMMLIRRLSEELVGASVLLLLIFRPTPQLADWLADLPHAQTVTLGQLDQSASEALVAALLDGASPEELRSLVERADGTPFFLEESIRFLKETGVIQRDRRGNWVCRTPIDTGLVPAQIEQVIIGRLDRLDPDARALLQVAAVLGQQFSGALLNAVGSQSKVQAQRLGELMDAALILPGEHGQEVVYHFKHAMIRDVVYSSMLFARRRELHDRIAATIEALHADDIDNYRVVLAQHYLRADRPDKAFPHLLDAAQHAQARYANAEALALYQQALAISPWRDQDDEPADMDVATTLYENLGDVLALNGDYATAREHYERLLSLLRGADQAVLLLRASLQRKVGGTYEHQGNLEHALVWLRRAAESIGGAATGAARALEHGRLLSDLGWLHYRRGDFEQAQQQLEQALEQVAPLEAHGEQARVLNRLGGVAWARGDLSLAQTFVEQSLAASERSGNLFGQANALNNLSILTENQGRFGEASYFGLQALELYERIGSRRDIAVAAINVGWAYYNREDYQQAQAYFGQALDHASHIRDTYLQMLAFRHVGRVLAAQQDWVSAERAIQRSQFIAAQLHLTAEELDGHTVLAEIALHQDNLSGALAEYERGLPLVADQETEEYGRFQRLEARLALAQQDKARAVALLEQNEALFVQLQNMPEVERTRRLLAEIRSQAVGE